MPGGIMGNRTGMRVVALVATTVALTSCAFVERVDVASDGTAGPQAGVSGYLSQDGRYDAFFDCRALVPEDGNGQCDVYLRDTLDNTTERVSLSTTGGDPDDSSSPDGISADGRYVLFSSNATNLITGGTAGTNLFVRDRTAGTTTLVTVTTNGLAPNSPIGRGHLSADGRHVLFDTSATNVASGAVANRADAYVRDLDAGTTSRVSLASNGAAANNDNQSGGISADGNLIVFESTATNLGGTAFYNHTYARNRSAGTTTLVDVTLSGPSTGGALPADNGISSNGRYVLFNSWGDNLTADDPVGTTDVYVRDLQTETTTLVYSPSGIPAIGDPPPLLALNPVGISNDGRYVLINGLRTGDMTHLTDFQVYVVDRADGRIDLVRSVSGSAFTRPAHATSISADGAYITLDTGDPLMTGAFIRSTTVPRINAVSPGTVILGAPAILDVTGTHLVTGTIFTFGAGVTTTAVTVVDEHHATVSITVAPDAPTGAHTIAAVVPGTGAGPLTGGTGIGFLSVQA